MSGRTLIKPPFSFQSQRKSNGAPNGFYGEIDWDRYVSKVGSQLQEELTTLYLQRQIHRKGGTCKHSKAIGSCVFQNSPEVDDEGYSIRPDDDSEADILAKLTNLSRSKLDL